MRKAENSTLDTEPFRVSVGSARPSDTWSHGFLCGGAALCTVHRTQHTHEAYKQSCLIYFFKYFNFQFTTDSLEQTTQEEIERKRARPVWVSESEEWVVWVFLSFCRRLSISVASSVLFGVLGGGSDHMWTRVSRPSGAKGCQILILNDGMSAERFVTPVSWLTNMTCHFCRCEFRMFRISSLLRIMLCDL